MPPNPPPSSLPKDIFAQVRRIEIRTRRLVTETFGGQYLSVFKGRGMEFAQVREYSSGDDVRTIDWNVTARTGRPHVRLYQDERELTVMLACDMSASQSFGSSAKLKREVAAELCALLAFAALENNDKAGLFLFTEGPELYLPPRKGRSHILALIRDLLAFQPARRGTSLDASLDALNRHLRRRSIVFLVSDFQDRGYERALRRAAIKHDLVPVILEDRRESDLPVVGAWLELRDPETGRRTLVHGRSLAAGQALRASHEARRRATERLFQSAGLDYVTVLTDQSYADALAKFFRQRAKRFR